MIPPLPTENDIQDRYIALADGMIDSFTQPDRSVPQWAVINGEVVVECMSGHEAQAFADAHGGRVFRRLVNGLGWEIAE